MPKNQTKAEKMLTIALAGGGSGGHITPLLPLARELKKASPNCRVVYIGLKGERVGGLHEKYDIFDEVFYVTSGKFRRYFGQNKLLSLLDLRTLGLNSRDFFRVMRGVASARKYLKKLKPDVFFSKGGYGAVPAGIAAHGLKIPIITHDSDAVPGLANRIIGRWAKVHATGMPAKYYPYDPKTIRYVGVPVDSRLSAVSQTEQAKYKNAIGVPTSCLLLMVTGGGLGAQTLNKLIMGSARQLLEQMPELYIVHICGLNIKGQQGEDEIREFYQRNLKKDDLGRVILLSFTDRFNDFSGAADLVVSRAGATTIAELAAQHKAAIIIPNPYLSGGHQTQNTKVLKEMGAVVPLDNGVSVNEFAKQVEQLLMDNQKRHELGERLAKTHVQNSVSFLADLIIRVAKDEI